MNITVSGSVRVEDFFGGLRSDVRISGNFYGKITNDGYGGENMPKNHGSFHRQTPAEVLVLIEKVSADAVRIDITEMI